MPGADQGTTPEHVRAMAAQLRADFPQDTRPITPPPIVPPAAGGAISETELSRRFNAHQSTSWQIHAMETVRGELHQVARTIVANVPPGREQALAITHLEQAMFIANAGIARYKAPENEFGGRTP